MDSMSGVFCVGGVERVRRRRREMDGEVSCLAVDGSWGRSGSAFVKCHDK